MREPAGTDRLPLESEALASALLNVARGLLVLILDSEGRIVQFNQTCEELTGYTQEEVRGRFVWDFLLVPDEVEPVKAVFRELAGRKHIESENHWIARDGRRILISWST